MKTFSLLFCAVAALLCGCATQPTTPVATPAAVAPAPAAAPEATPPAVATPSIAEQLMQMAPDARCKQIVTTCLVAGQPLRVMLDTGATHTVFHTESAKQLQQVQWIDTSHIQFNGNANQRPEMFIAPVLLGPGEFEPRPLLALDLSGVRSMMAEKIDGIIGMDLLNPLPFTFDFHTNAFYWGTPESANLFPLMGQTDPNGRLFLIVASGEKSFPLLLDTGSSITRIVESNWTPGRGETIQAQVSDVNAAAHISTIEGKAGTLTLAPGIETEAFHPLMGGENEPAILGVDALKGLIFVHLPPENGVLPPPEGLLSSFFIAKPTTTP